MIEINKKQLNPYEELYQRKLTEVEVAEIRQNLTGLYTLLIKIHKRIEKEKII